METNRRIENFIFIEGFMFFVPPIQKRKMRVKGKGATKK